MLVLKSEFNTNKELTFSSKAVCVLSPVEGFHLIARALLSLLGDRLVKELLHSKNKKRFRTPFLILQLVRNRELVSVPGRTNQSTRTPIFLLWFFQILIGPSRY